MDQLLVYKGEAVLGRYALRATELLIGRAGHVPLRSPEVSRIHALLAWRGDRYVITDLGSRNGTRVNGAMVEEASLKDGDCVEVGQFRLFCQFKGFPPTLLAPPVNAPDGLDDTLDLGLRPASSVMKAPKSIMLHPAQVAAESGRVPRPRLAPSPPRTEDSAMAVATREGPPQVELTRPHITTADVSKAEAPKAIADPPRALTDAAKADAARHEAAKAEAPKAEAPKADAADAPKADAAPAAAAAAAADAPEADAKKDGPPLDAEAQAKADAKAAKIAAALAAKAAKQAAKAAEGGAAAPAADAKAADAKADAPKPEKAARPAKDAGQKRESVGEDVKRAYDAYFIRLRRLVRADAGDAKEQKPTQVDLTYHRRPGPGKRRLRRAWIAATVLALAWMGWTLGYRQDRTVLASASVSRGHQVFGNDCARCHVHPFALQIPDTACLECHRSLLDGPARADLATLVSEHPVVREGPLRKANGEYFAGSWPTHHPEQARTLRCAECHVEHGDTTQLANAVTDRHCTTCHADLKADVKPGAALAIVRPTGMSVKDVGSHPELAPLAPLAAGDAPPPAGSSASLVSRAPGQAPRDMARLYLNHARHLEAPLSAMSSPERQAWIAARGRDRMDCSDCHELDAGRARMQPVAYERHCASCHQLGVTAVTRPERDIAALGADPAGKPTPIPHGLQGGTLVGLVRGLDLEGQARRFYEAYAKAHADERAAAPPGGGGPRRPPGPGGPRPPGGGGNTAAPQTEAQWVEARVTRWREQRGVAGALVELMGSETKGGCVKCHALDVPRVDASAAAADQRTAMAEAMTAEWAAELATGTRPAPAIVSPRVPAVWLPHARFSHDRHQVLDCAQCHQGVERSQETSDVLLPSFTQGPGACVSCHSPGEGAPFACTTCHDYHDRAGAQTASGGLPGADLRRGGAGP